MDAKASAKGPRFAQNLTVEVVGLSPACGRGKTARPISEHRSFLPKGNPLNETYSPG